MKLSDGICNGEYIIADIELDSNVMRRLYTLGMTRGSKVRVLNMKKRGPMIIKVRGTRFALGRGFAEGIFVEENVNE